MARVFFTRHLRQFVDREPVVAEGTTLREVLEALFTAMPVLRGYVLDDQDRLRQHVCLFVDDERVDFEGSLDTPVGGDSEVYIMQALSGGAS